MSLPCPREGVYVIADDSHGSLDETLRIVKKLLQGGIAMLQYRNKRNPSIHAARALREFCHECACPMLVNDDPELALQVGADGVHLGRDDPSIEQARGTLGDAAIIGMSCYNDVSKALRVAQQGADYVALGSFYASTTKPDAAHAELSSLRALRGNLSIPIIAIGGITPDNGAAVLDAGADMLAAASGLFDAQDLIAALAAYNRLFAKLG
ncbi:MAG: thiamine phosphate synthase [Candidatus Eutrophobiaceae bacterium]